jgi:hypothetical protein
VEFVRTVDGRRGDDNRLLRSVPRAAFVPATRYLFAQHRVRGDNFCDPHTPHAVAMIR